MWRWCVLDPGVVETISELATWTGVLEEKTDERQLKSDPHIL